MKYLILISVVSLLFSCKNSDSPSSDGPPHIPTGVLVYSGNVKTTDLQSLSYAGLSAISNLVAYKNYTIDFVNKTVNLNQEACTVQTALSIPDEAEIITSIGNIHLCEFRPDLPKQNFICPLNFLATEAFYAYKYLNLNYENQIDPTNLILSTPDFCFLTYGVCSKSDIDLADIIDIKYKDILTCP